MKTQGGWVSEEAGWGYRCREDVCRNEGGGVFFFFFFRAETPTKVCSWLRWAKSRDPNRESLAI